MQEDGYVIVGSEAASVCLQAKGLLRLENPAEARRESHALGKGQGVAQPPRGTATRGLFGHTKLTVLGYCNSQQMQQFLTFISAGFRIRLWG